MAYVTENYKNKGVAQLKLKSVKQTMTDCRQNKAAEKIVSTNGKQFSSPLFVII